MRPHPPGLAALALLVLPAFRAAVQDPDPRHAEAAKLLLSGPEGDVRRGAELCAQLNDVPAVELLLRVLERTSVSGAGFLPPAHYRDVSWDGLIRITDPYARQRVEEELKKSKDAFVRQWCAELLGIYAQSDFGPTLRRALNDKDDGVRRAAARSLGQVGDPEASDALGKLVKVKDDVLRANALEALARLDPAAHRAQLLEAAGGDKDGGVRCALLGAAALIYPDDAERLAAAALGDEDWRPRLQAVEILAELRTKAGVDALLSALEDGRAAVAARAQHALATLTGEKHTRPDAWRRWWTANRETFDFPEGGGPAPAAEGQTVASYYGLKVESDHVAFLIDKSRAMSEPLTSGGGSKDEAALKELSQVLAALQGRLDFNVHVYNLEVASFEGQPVALDKQTEKRALAFVQEAKLAGSKDIWQVLEAVLADPTIDTAYLLSSGEPDTGTYVHWNRVTWHLKDLNRFHKVRIHTIAYSDSQWYRDQLEQIAKATGGEFRWFE